MSARAVLLCCVLPVTLGCAPPQPARWVEGGAPLTVVTATWTRPELPVVTVAANGEVHVDGDLQFTFDKQGRVFDASGDPLALLSSDGQLFSADNVYWGRVGLHNASPPWSAVAWTRIEASGEALWFDESGRAHAHGNWTGCVDLGLRTCTLVTQMLLLAETRFDDVPYYSPSPAYPFMPYPIRPGVGVGFGIGF
jgi:hypothetical protein